MKTTRRAVVALLSLIGVVGGVNAVSVGVAHAAPLTVTGCNQADTGSTDTGAISITFDDALLANGTMIPLHDNTGAVTFPAPADNSMAAPVCGLHRGPGGALQQEWLYCTAPNLNTCGTEPMVAKGSAATNVNTFSALDKARLAWLLANRIDNSTKTTRIISQRLVWCAVEDTPAGQNAPGYYHDARDTFVACPDWPNLDPTLATNPSVAVTPASANAANGATVRFDVLTDAKELTVDAAGFDGMKVCDGVTGATLANGTLSIAAPDKTKPVGLCGWRTTSGSGSLQLTVAGLTATTLEFWQRPANTSACQGMLSTETSSQDGATARAAAVFAADVTPTTTPVEDTTVTAPPTTPPSGVDGTSTTTVPDGVGGLPTAVTLPRTGAGSSGTDLRLPAGFLLVGLGLVVLGRRRVTQR